MPNADEQIDNLFSESLLAINFECWNEY